MSYYTSQKHGIDMSVLNRTNRSGTGSGGFFKISSLQNGRNSTGRSRPPTDNRYTSNAMALGGIAFKPSDSDHRNSLSRSTSQKQVHAQRGSGPTNSGSSGNNALNGRITSFRSRKTGRSEMGDISISGVKAMNHDERHRSSSNSAGDINNERHFPQRPDNPKRSDTSMGGRGVLTDNQTTFPTRTRSLPRPQTSIDTGTSNASGSSSFALSFLPNQPASSRRRTSAGPPQNPIIRERNSRFTGTLNSINSISLGSDSNDLSLRPTSLTSLKSNNSARSNGSLGSHDPSPPTLMQRPAKPPTRTSSETSTNRSIIPALNGIGLDDEQSAFSPVFTARTHQHNVGNGNETPLSSVNPTKRESFFESSTEPSSSTLLSSNIPTGGGGFTSRLNTSLASLNINTTSSFQKHMAATNSERNDSQNDGSNTPTTGGSSNHQLKAFASLNTHNNTNGNDNNNVSTSATSSNSKSKYNKNNDHSAVATTDGIMISESAELPNVSIVVRNKKARLASPERLNLDRRDFKMCPILENEHRLRLLNYQNNSIQRISNLHGLPNLIFLDLYNNNITKISGLNAVPSLRVLMLGKNQIRRIENLDFLSKLDVLDLHSNCISKVENISHLAGLRVLNLAGNNLVEMSGFSSLVLLAELNLRRNKISQLYNMEKLPSLQRLFLSNNDISSMEAMDSVFKIPNLKELALDSNPLVTSFRSSRQQPSSTLYRANIIGRLPKLQTLDLKRLTEEDRVRLQEALQKDEARKKEAAKREKEEDLRLQAIGKARDWWDRVKSGSSPPGLHRRGYSEVEVQGQRRILIIYGYALDALDARSLLHGVSAVIFQYVHFSSIVPHLPRLSGLAEVRSVSFKDNQLTSLSQLDSLKTLPSHVTSVSVEQNPISKLTIAPAYVAHLLKNVSIWCGRALTAASRAQGDLLFGTMAPILSKSVSARNKNNSVAVAIRNFADDQSRLIIKDAELTAKKSAEFDVLWPKILLETVKQALDECSSPEARRDFYQRELESL